VAHRYFDTLSRDPQRVFLVRLAATVGRENTEVVVTKVRTTQAKKQGRKQ